jgi:hypothetical protein
MNDTENNSLVQVSAEPTPMQMIAEAVRLNLDPEKLHALMDLKERIEKSAAEKLFSAAMAKCQAEMPTVVRDKENSHTRSGYASLEAVQRSIKPVYLAHGFAITISEAEAQKPEMIRVKLVLRHTGGHCETYYREGANDSKGAKGGAVKTDLQGAQSTVSYLARNMLLSIFGVTVSDQDNDGNDQPITTAQCEEIESLVKVKGIDITRFLEWAGGEHLAMMPASHYAKAIDYLRRLPDPPKTKELPRCQKIAARWQKLHPAKREDRTAFCVWVENRSGQKIKAAAELAEDSMDKLEIVLRELEGGRK